MSKLIQHIKDSKPANGWEVLWLFIKSKESKWVLIAVVIILIYNPDWIVKIKLGLMNGILQLMK
jgi:hypothetical protein